MTRVSLMVLLVLLQLTSCGESRPLPPLTGSAGSGQGGAAGQGSGPEEDTTRRGPGDPCDHDAQCVTGATCSAEVDQGIPGGACVVICSGDDPTECPSGTICDAGETGLGSCMRICQSPSDCPAGRVCSGLSGVCNFLCAADEDCSSGHCDAYTGYCRADDKDPAGLGLNAPCTSNDDCRSAFCNPATLRCTSLCRRSRPNCPEQGVCVATSQQGDEGLCSPACLPDGTCADRAFQCGKLDLETAPSCALPNGEACLGSKAEHTLGGNCTCKADCPDNVLCFAEQDGFGNPNGYCYQACRDAAECGDGFSCANGFCQPTCTTDGDCPAGDLCTKWGICISFCEQDTDCGYSRCNQELGQCGVGTPIGAPIGAPCTASTECAAGMCLSLSSEKGFCSRLCRFGPEACPGDAVCSENDGTSVGVCFPPCVRDEDCPIIDLNCRTDATGASFCALPPVLDVPLERDDALAKACVAAVERDTRCGELTVAPDCEHAALVEGPGALVAYNCVASAECGKAQACLPARTAVGDEACSVVKSTCGSVNVDRCEHLNLEAGWLRPSVLDALQVCYQRRACPPLVFCVDQWLETVFR